MEQARLAAWLQQEWDETLVRISPVAGGCIHRAWCLQLASGRRLFAKSNQAALRPVLAAEADGLQALAAAALTTRWTVPSPLRLIQLDAEALLLLPWLELAPGSRTTAMTWQELGAALAALHRCSLVGHDGRFGWERDNHIGSAPQCNGWDEDWGRFFAGQRLGRQLAWAERCGHRLQGAEALLDQVPGWLAAHGAEACLVHGDLWSGNAAALQGGGGALFDPAVYRGDREVDQAMARLFGGFPQAFFAGYEAAWPLPAGHQRRRDLYNLYHLLNHANLFGGHYWQQAQDSLMALLKGRW